MPLDSAASPSDGTLAAAGALAAWIIDQNSDDPKLPHPLNFGIPESDLPPASAAVRQVVVRLLRECRHFHPDWNELDSDFLLAQRALITAIENSGDKNAISDFGFAEAIECRLNPARAITTPIADPRPGDVVADLRWTIEAGGWGRVVGEVPLNPGGFFTGGAQVPRLLFVTTASCAKRLDERLVELRTARELVYDWQLTAAFDGGQLVWCLGPDDARLNGQRRFSDATVHQIRDDLIALRMLTHDTPRRALPPPSPPLVEKAIESAEAA